MLFIHIGAHKSGSSSIQQFMSLNAESLQTHGIHYPYLGGPGRAQHILAQQLRNEGPSSRGIQAWSTLRTFADSRPDVKIVLSSEVFETLRSDEIVEIGKRLSGVPVTIMIYIRQTAETLPSRYSQLTKTGINFRNFDEFYIHNRPRPGTFGRHFQMWADVFGWDSLRIRDLDKRSLTGGSLIDDFLSALDLSVSDLSGSYVAGLTPANASPSWKTIELLRTLFTAVSDEVDRDPTNQNRVRRDLGSLFSRTCLKIMSDLGHEKDRAQYLNSTQRAECDAAYAEGIDWLNTRIVGPKLPLPLAAAMPGRPFLPGIEHIPRQERMAIAKRLDKSLRGSRKRLAEAGVSREMCKHLVELVRDSNGTETKRGAGPTGGRRMSRIRAAWHQARQQFS